MRIIELHQKRPFGIVTRYNDGRKIELIARATTRSYEAIVKFTNASFL